MEKTYGAGNVTVSKDDSNNTYTVAITGKSNYIIDSKGKVEKAGPSIVVDTNSIQITDIDGSSVAKGEVELGTALKINFSASVENGTVTINPEVPHVMTLEEVEEMRVVFTLEGISEGKSIEPLTYTINLKEYYNIPELTVGDYIQYDVTYKDIYNTSTGITYGKNNGWRLLNKEEKTDGTYDIEIISSGIPVGLYFVGYKSMYPTYTVSNFEYDGSELGKWAGNSEQRVDFATDFYTSGNNNNENMYGAAGLYYNFPSIIFKPYPENFDSNMYNYGYYREINGKNSTENSAGNLDGTEFTTPNTVLKSGTITGVRSVSLSDIYPEFKNTDRDEDGKYMYDDSHSILEYTTPTTDKTDKAQGLFRLRDYTPDPNTSGKYFLASPSTYHDGCLYFVNYNGKFNGGLEAYGGLRPVVKISGVNLTYSNGGWSICSK